MFSFRRFVVVMAVISLVSFGALAQSTDSSSSTPAQDQTPPQAPAVAPSQGQVTVQARIKARREARRAQAIHDTYGRLYEVFVGGGAGEYDLVDIFQGIRGGAFQGGVAEHGQEAFIGV